MPAKNKVVKKTKTVKELELQIQRLKADLEDSESNLEIAEEEIQVLKCKEKYFKDTQAEVKDLEKVNLKLHTTILGFAEDLIKQKQEFFKQIDRINRTLHYFGISPQVLEQQMFERRSRNEQAYKINTNEVSEEETKSFAS